MHCCALVRNGMISPEERPEILLETLAWQPEGADEALVIDVPRLFQDALN